jgi:chromate reductase, NAD(P)H dehydrogenase (quinone)
MSSHVRILGIAGSLRRGSYNQSALRAAKLLVPENVEIDIFELDGIPMFNEDDEKRPPSSMGTEEAHSQRRCCSDRNAECNYSVPGVLKNAIDWASRPQGDSAWSGKSAAIMGASLGAIGTARAQHHLRQIFVTLNDPNSRYARNVRACAWIPQFSRAERIHNTLPESECAVCLIGQT